MGEAAELAELAPASGRRRAGSAQVVRQVAMLQLIPLHPRRISTTAVQQRLTEMGFRTTVRTLQRDLLMLQSAFPIEFDKKTRPYAWRWSRDAEAHPLPVAIESAPVRFAAIVTPSIARRIGATDVKLESDGRMRVTMTVSGGPALRRWVLGFGDGVEVLEPRSLRQEIRNVARRLARRYHSAKIVPLEKE